MRTTEVPTKVTVYEQVVPVVVVNDLRVTTQDCDCGEEHRNEAYGMFDPDGPAIILSDGQGWERLRETLLHENVHALLQFTGLTETLGGRDEEFASRLAPALLCWLRANRKVVKWLQKQLT